MTDSLKNLNALSATISFPPPSISSVTFTSMPDPDDNNDPVLLARIAQGDELAFAALFHAWRDKLYSFALRLSNSETLAEEAVQDSFLKIWQNQADLTEIQQFGPYLFRMAKNHLLNALARQAREKAILAELGRRTDDAGGDPAQTLDSKQFRARLQQAIDGLPAQQRKVYTLSREQGWRQDEIAQHLHISTSTVKAHMTQALRSLRDELRDAYPSGTLPLLLALTSLLAQ
jgi:RNA polymerase sigma-70 factor (family 1)